MASSFSQFGASKFAPRVAPQRVESNNPSSEQQATGMGIGAVGGGAAGFQTGASLSPLLAGVPVVGPALAAAAPIVGAGIGAISGGVKGYKSGEADVGQAVQNVIGAAGAAKGTKAFGPEARKLAAMARAAKQGAWSGGGSLIG